jgi:di/tricarboxylate transporter
VAGLIGRPVLRLAGGSEARLIALIMLLVGVLSGFMNDIGVAALMLPVVVDIARRTARPPSRLLMPLAFASLLGGLNTVIGTPPNILVSEALRQYGLEPFHMFDYTPTGIVVMVAGIAFMVLVGRHLLPSRDIKDLPENDQEAPGEFFGLRERMFVIRLPEDSALGGKTLLQSRLGAALGLNVLAILRADENQLAPGPAQSSVLATVCWSKADPTTWTSFAGGAPWWWKPTIWPLSGCSRRSSTWPRAWWDWWEGWDRWR